MHKYVLVKPNYIGQRLLISVMSLHCNDNIFWSKTIIVQLHSQFSILLQPIVGPSACLSRRESLIKRQFVQPHLVLASGTSRRRASLGVGSAFFGVRLFGHHDCEVGITTSGILVTWLSYWKTWNQNWVSLTRKRAEWKQRGCTLPLQGRYQTHRGSYPWMFRRGWSSLCSWERWGPYSSDKSRQESGLNIFTKDT
jgi:hypothetical protein